MDFLPGIISEIVAFYRSPAFSVIKFILGIYAVVLLADIILLLIQRGLSGNIRETFLGMDVPPELTTKKNKLFAKWIKVKEKLKSSNEGDWKTAVTEADSLIDDLIKRMGYGGNNLGERLAEINPGQIATVEKIREAHDVRNKVISEPTFRLSKEDAQKALENYEEFLKEFEVLE